MKRFLLKIILTSLEIEKKLSNLKSFLKLIEYLVIIMNITSIHLTFLYSEITLFNMDVPENP